LEVQVDLPERRETKDFAAHIFKDKNGISYLNDKATVFSGALSAKTPDHSQFVRRVS